MAMATTLQRLSQINDKLQTLDEQTGPRGQIENILRLVEEWMVELQQAPAVSLGSVRDWIARGLKTLPPNATWLQRITWWLIGLSGGQDEQFDRTIAAIIWPGNWPQGPDNPTGQSHTV